MYKFQINHFLNHISALGSKEISVIFIILFYLINQKTLSYQLLVGSVFVYSIGILIRILYFKERPKKRKYNNILEKIDASSFPSMHSSRTTLLLIILLNHFNFEIKITIFLTLIWTSILYARIHKKRHDYLDILAGIALGIISYQLIF